MLCVLTFENERGSQVMRTLWAVLAAITMAVPAAADDSAAAASDTVERAVPSVTVADAAMAEVQARVLLSGTLVARQEVLIYPQVSGYEITQVLVEAGDTVEKGQVLVRLSSDTLAAQLAQAEAEYQRAEAGVSQAQSAIASAEATRTQAVTALNRMQRLRNSGNAAQAALDDAIAAEAGAQAQAASAADGLAVAQAALAQADAARAIAKLNLDRTDITAPIGGLILSRTAELGAIAASGGEPMFTLIADGEIELSAEVTETSLHQLAIGQLAEIDVAGVGRVAGKVRLLPAGVNPVTRLGKLRIALEPNPGLRTGLFASGTVVTARREAVTVPASAVLADDEGDSVRLVKDGVVTVQPVQAGLLWQSLREIVSGLEPGQSVIARSGAFFRSGDKVRTVSAQASETAAPEMATKAADEAIEQAAPSPAAARASAGAAEAGEKQP